MKKAREREYIFREVRDESRSRESPNAVDEVMNDVPPSVVPLTLLLVVLFIDVNGTFNNVHDDAVAVVVVAVAVCIVVGVIIGNTPSFCNNTIEDNLLINVLWEMFK